MKVQDGILTSDQKTALRLMAPFASLHGYHLGGGTALALMLGHRRSADFDWFTPEPLPVPQDFAHQLLVADVPFVTESVGRGALHGTVRGIRTSWLEYRYPFLEPLETWPETGLALASRADIASMKLAAITSRATRKDFIDVHALRQSGISIQAMLDGYGRKYSVSDIAHVLYSLTFFDEADAEPMPTMLSAVTWAQVKRDLTHWVRRIR